ncbi:MAG: hypothetical protein IPG93_02855 [Burkholderiales bacterium]|nr:hypothetical protein [Burkholderiales bacterium]
MASGWRPHGSPGSSYCCSSWATMKVTFRTIASWAV